MVYVINQTLLTSKFLKITKQDSVSGRTTCQECKKYIRKFQLDNFCAALISLKYQQQKSVNATKYLLVINKGVHEYPLLNDLLVLGLLVDELPEVVVGHHNGVSVGCQFENVPKERNKSSSNPAFDNEKHLIRIQRVVPNFPRSELRILI